MGSGTSPAALPSPAQRVKKDAYLITSPGFASRLLVNLAVVGAAATVCLQYQPLYEVGFAAHGWLTEQMMHGAHRMAWWSLLGLLSSSCCALQILLNAFSFGCAGFNTTLGPLRPTFIAVTLTVQALAWSVAYPRRFQWAPTAASTALATVLTLLPEALALHTARRERRAREAAAGAAASLPALQYRVSSLGCAACVSKVSKVLNGIGEVVVHHVSLEEGLATVRLSQDSNVPEVRKIIEAKLEAAGFPVTFEGDCSGGAAVAADAPRVVDSAGWARSNAAAVCAGLLSSSCCLLQLALNGLAVLNVAHIGCAGFNKVLGPWRTEMRTVTLGWLGVMWALSVRHKWPKLPLVFSTLLAVGLAWLPELLLFLGGAQWGGGIAPAVEGAEHVLLSIVGMGCEACSLHVRSMLEMAPGVLSSSVDLASGRADMWVNPAWGFNLTSVVEALATDGYEAHASGVQPSGVQPSGVQPPATTK